jgi:hypothetical protein
MRPVSAWKTRNLGLLVSLDGGKTFNSKPLEVAHTVHAFGNQILVSQGFSLGNLYYSKDGGTNFSEATIAGGVRAPHSVATEGGIVHINESDCRDQSWCLQPC